MGKNNVAKHVTQEGDTISTNNHPEQDDGHGGTGRTKERAVDDDKEE